MERKNNPEQNRNYPNFMKLFTWTNTSKMIKKLDDLFTVLKARKSKRLVVAFANDVHSISAVSKAVDMGIVEATLVGNPELIKTVCSKKNINIRKFEIVHVEEEMTAACKAVSLINEGKGEILMKGLVSTDKYMRAILNKENGLMMPGSILSHVTVMETQITDYRRCSHHSAARIKGKNCHYQLSYSSGTRLGNSIAQSGRAGGYRTGYAQNACLCGCCFNFKNG